MAIPKTVQKLGAGVAQLVDGTALFVQTGHEVANRSVTVKSTNRGSDGRSTTKTGKLLDKIGNKLPLRTCRPGTDGKLEQRGRLKLKDGSPVRLARNDQGDLDLRRLSRAMSPRLGNQSQGVQSQQLLRQQPQPSSTDQAQADIDRLQNQLGEIRGDDRHLDRLARQKRQIRELKTEIRSKGGQEGWLAWFKARPEKKQLAALEKAFDTQTRDTKTSLRVSLRGLNRLQQRIEASQPLPEQPDIMKDQIKELKREAFRSLIMASVPGLSAGNAEFDDLMKDSNDYKWPILEGMDALVDSLMLLDDKLDDVEQKDLIGSVLNQVSAHGFTRDWAATTTADINSKAETDLADARAKLGKFDQEQTKIKARQDKLATQIKMVMRGNPVNNGKLDQLNSQLKDSSAQQVANNGNRVELSRRIDRLKRELEFPESSGEQGVVEQKQRSLESMKVLVAGIADGSLTDYAIGGNDQLDELRLAIKQKAALSRSGNRQESAQLVEARHELSLTQRRLAANLRINSKNEQVPTWFHGWESPEKRVFAGDSMGDVRMDAALLKGLRTASDDGKPLADLKSNLLMAKVRMLQSEVARLEDAAANDTPDDKGLRARHDFIDRLDHLAEKIDEELDDGLNDVFDDYGTLGGLGVDAALGAQLYPIGHQYDARRRLSREDAVELKERVGRVRLEAQQLGDLPGQSLKQARQQYGSLADYGIDRDTATILLTDDRLRELGLHEPVGRDTSKIPVSIRASVTEVQRAKLRRDIDRMLDDPQQRVVVVAKIGKLIDLKLASVESLDAARRLVGSMHGQLTGNTSRIAGNVLTEVQEKWSPEIQSNAFVNDVLQEITGDHGNFALRIDDQVFGQNLQSYLVPEDCSLENLRSLAGNTQALNRTSRQIILAKMAYENAAEEHKEAQLEILEQKLRTCQDLQAERPELMANAYGPQAVVRTAVRAAVLAARPAGVPLDYYDPTEHLNEIEATLSGWGLDVAEIRPEITEAVTTTLDRDVLDGWRQDFARQAPSLRSAQPAPPREFGLNLNLLMDESEVSGDEEKVAIDDLVDQPPASPRPLSGPQKLAFAEARQLTASVKEFTPGSYLYYSSSSTLAQSLNAKLDVEATGTSAKLSRSDAHTAELKVSAGSNGYSVTLYAGPGKTYSAEASAKIGLFTGKLSGSYGSKKFAGFTFNFKSDGREPDSMARVQSFIRKIATDEACTADDLIELTDGVEGFTQDQTSAGVGAGGKLGYEKSVGAGKAKVGVEAGLSHDVDYNWFAKDKYSYSANQTSHDVLTMYKLTGTTKVSASLQAGAPVPSLASKSGLGDSRQQRKLKRRLDGIQDVASSGNTDGPSVRPTTGKAGLGGSLATVRTGVIYGWSGDTRNNDTLTYTSADRGFSSWNGGNAWRSLGRLAMLCGCEQDFERWKEDPDLQPFRDEFDELARRGSGADFVKIYMGIKPEKLEEANNLVVEARALEAPGMQNPERAMRAAKLRRQAQAIIDDQSNYRPTGVGFAPTEEWSGSASWSTASFSDEHDFSSRRSGESPESGKSNESGINMGVASLGYTTKSGDSTWGELSLVTKIPLHQPDPVQSQAPPRTQSTVSQTLPTSPTQPTTAPIPTGPEVDAPTSVHSTAVSSGIVALLEQGLVDERDMKPKIANALDKSRLLVISAKINNMYGLTHKPTQSNRFYKQRQKESLCAVHAANAFFGGPMLYHEAFTNWKMANNINEDFDISRRSQLDARHGSHPFELVGYLNFLNDRGIVDGRVEEVPVTTGPIPDVVGDRCIIGYDKPSAHFVTFRQHNSAWYKIDSRGDRGPTELPMSPEEFIQTLRHVDDQTISLIRPVQDSGVE